MNGKELFQAGRLREALAAQTQEVKSRPEDASSRYFLFTFLCYAGELERAETQLDALVHQDQSLLGAAAYFRNLLSSELERQRVYRGEGAPVLPPDATPPHVQKRADALRLCAAGDASGAAAALQEAEASTPSVSGRLNGAAFRSLRDCDQLLGPVLEVFAGGRYLWVPFANLRRVEPRGGRKDLDHLWLPAEMEDASGRTASVNLPLLYAGSAAHADDEVRIGFSTDWLDWGGVVFRGQGQKLFAASGDGGERQLGITQVEAINIEA
jgi:type VI secretion system protein ImpE